MLSSASSPPLAITCGSRSSMPDEEPSLAGLHLDRHQRLHQAEAGGQVIGDGAGRQHPPALRQHLDLLGLEDQVADGEHQPVGADDHARAEARAPQGLDGACLRCRGGAQADHRRTGLPQDARLLGHCAVRVCGGVGGRLGRRHRRGGQAFGNEQGQAQGERRACQPVGTMRVRRSAPPGRGTRLVREPMEGVHGAPPRQAADARQHRSFAIPCKAKGIAAGESQTPGQSPSG